MNSVLGGVLGFIIGLIITKILLKDKKPQELRHDKDLKRQYGILIWAISILGALIGYAL